MKQMGSKELSAEDRERLTREALADVDAGHVIDYQAVQAWSNSLDPKSGLLTVTPHPAAARRSSR